MAQIVADTFNRANAASLGANWTTQSGATAHTILSNQCVAAGSVGGFLSQIDLYTGAGWTGGNDQYSEYQIIAETGSLGTSEFGPIVRGATGANTMYLAVFNNNDDHGLGAPGLTVQIFRYVAGVFTAVGSAVTTTVNANDVLRLEAQGTTITCKQNGTVLCSGTDSAIASGNPGLYSGTAQAGTVTSDNWAAGDFSTGPVVDRPRGDQRPFPFLPGGLGSR